MWVPKRGSAWVQPLNPPPPLPRPTPSPLPRPTPSSTSGTAAPSAPRCGTGSAATFPLSHRGTKRYTCEVLERARAEGVPTVAIGGEGARGADIVTVAQESSGTFTASHLGALARLVQLAVAATSTATQPQSSATAAPSRPLKPGDQGSEVKVLQRALASLGYSPGAVDGNYGSSTQRVLARFQSSSKLTPDGILGPLTLVALRNALKGL